MSSWADMESRLQALWAERMGLDTRAEVADAAADAAEHLAWLGFDGPVALLLGLAHMAEALGVDVDPLA